MPVGSVPYSIACFATEAVLGSGEHAGAPAASQVRAGKMRGIHGIRSKPGPGSVASLTGAGHPDRRRVRPVEAIRRRRRSAPPAGTRPRAGTDSFGASATASSASGPARRASPLRWTKKKGDRRLLGDESPPGGDSIAAGPRSLRHRVMRWGHGGPRCLSPAASRIPAILAAWVTGSGSESNDPATGGVLLTSYEEPRREARVGSTPSEGATTARHTRGCFGRGGGGGPGW